MVLKKILVRAKAVALGIDQTLNALVNGYADETLSAASFRLSAKSVHWYRFRVIVDILFFWDREKRGTITVRHCELSWESELYRRHLPDDYKTRK